jgi:hypothetical protein
MSFAMPEKGGAIVSARPECWLRAGFAKRFAGIQNAGSR